MEPQSLINMLRRVQRAEASGLLLHAGRSSPWVGRDSMALGELIGRIGRDRRGYLEWLSERIYELGGTPAPARFAIEYAETNYLTFEHLLPWIARDQRQLLALYRSLPIGEAPAEIRDRLTRQVEQIEAEVEAIENAGRRLAEERAAADAEARAAAAGEAEAPEESKQA